MDHIAPLAAERAAEALDLAHLHIAARQAKRHRVRLQVIVEQNDAKLLHQELDALILIVCFGNIRLILPHWTIPPLGTPLPTKARLSAKHLRRFDEDPRYFLFRHFPSFY